jgi:uncharacterized protein (DUF1810 family)
VDDPFDLTRFLLAQESNYEHALEEIREGGKRSHWMWYVFPQFRGLGASRMSLTYAIRSRAEAEAYLRHPILGARLRQCAEAALAIEGQTAVAIFGSPDDLKLRSCATLFALVSPKASIFHRLIDRFFAGRPDDRTLTLLGAVEI